MNIIEEIIATKPVTAKDGRELVLITTVSNKEIWTTKDQYIPNSKNVTYLLQPRGSDWKNPKTGATGKFKEDTLKYVGCDGKAQDLTALKWLVKQGITPVFSMS